MRHHSFAPARRRQRRRRPPPASRAAAAAFLAAVAAVGLAGCAARAGASTPIHVATAFVPAPQTPGTTVAYVVIRNNGPADRLIAARTSAGGRVAFRAAAGAGASASRPVSAIAIPAHSTVAMAPDTVHMLITGAGPLRGGKDITLTLVFARAGPVPVVAQITNPETGGSSYFLN